ncbi:MAG: tetratricopeptide repeat protein [Deltaproteobacteria bacterium]|nr:tetratricopeptide repeat protein [Deltaproteobacteria bacterium]
MRKKTLIASTVALVLLLFVLALPLTAAPLSDWDYYQQSGHTAPKWDSLVEAGFGAFDSGNTDTAINFLERARSLGCKDGLVTAKLAAIQELRGNIVLALKLLEQAEPILRNRYPKHPVTLGLSEHLGTLLYQQNRYDEALTKFLDSLRMQGNDFLKLYLVGQIYRMKGMTKEAIAYFEKSLSCDVPLQQQAQPNLKLLVEMELLKLYSDNKKDDKALNMANQILARDPQNPAAISVRDEISRRKYKQKEQDVMQRIIEKQ